MTMILSSYTKDPNDILDYTMDWSSWLGGVDTITSSTFTIPSGLTSVVDTHGSSTATVWLSGGIVGQSYTVTNQISTLGGRTVERSFQIVCQDL